MSKHHLRKDTTCLNCGHQVTEHFCPSCGQENTESRQSFGHLAGHFFEDLTHYEGKFWKTMLLLISRPAYLTKAYLAGKRVSFVPPVRLYFFISFVTFLLPHFLPDGNKDVEKAQASAISDTTSISIQSTKRLTVKSDPPRYHSIHEMDSVEQSLPKEQRLSFGERFTERSKINLAGLSRKEQHEKMISGLVSNFPKALFIYLPLFAFVLWFFHGKKRWIYFDHAIFTIHYFCFMMLTISIVNVLMVPFDLIMKRGDVYNSIAELLSGGMIAWFIYYFFRAHHKMYNESWMVSALKGTIVFVLNLVIFIILLLGVLIFTFTTIH